MAQALSNEQVKAILKGAGFQGQALAQAAATAWAESRFHAEQVYVNHGGPASGSRDRGLFQLNDHFYPLITDAMAFDPAINAKMAWVISKHGTDWSAWSTHTKDNDPSNYYENFMPMFASWAHEGAETVTPISISKLKTVFDHMSGRVKYHLGGKAVDLTEDSALIHEVDCSGFTKFAAARASNQGFILPDGSGNQHAFCIQHGFQKADYELAAQQANPKKLFIAFIGEAGVSGAASHVWFLHAGRTWESYGGHGVGSRIWNASIEGGRTTLAEQCSGCYLLPSVA